MKNPQCASFPVVCLGGSALDLSAYGQLLADLPVDLGIAIVVIDDLKKDSSLFSEGLPHCTRMPTEVITDGLLLMPNHVYFLRNGHDLHVLDGKFLLKPKSKPVGWPDVITVFLRSLTEHWHGKLIAVILAGYDGDGAPALRGIKEAGGTTIAQKADTAEKPDMPLSAIASGYIDHILSIDDIAKAIVRISNAELYPTVLPA